ncbi:bifunctional helix-turn-helix transcriptional regulator/GNAT family N-acetyltransferase [Streptomyces hoynatensis]|uniref:GNAT family N-acetyltransferase n=1 Tax=Streptomyces hoynatensis TaxID=1141874 RepID=A0A3A9YWF9_9ACTN|nr:helix-turn-helix domain-containing GNAT family N-acetyltransferase [Streptomyces hoynatensis]RKN40402.1 GNAT family N-acetyltransferase [Streptomyces hoynatensis]
MSSHLTERADVTAFRRFSRYFTARTGVLSDRYLGLARPLGQARLLFELGEATGLGELRRRLEIDAGQLSRMLAALQAQRLVRLSRDPADRRRRVVELTARGRRERAEQQRRADEVAERLLSALPPEQRAELTGALTKAERLLRLAVIELRPLDPASAEARYCLTAYATELAARFPEGFEVSDLLTADQLSAGRGRFLAAFEEERPVGCGAVRTLQPGVAELRHLWVAAQARGAGLGRRLLRALEAEAAELGHHTVRLGTHEVLGEAIGLYRRCGYREIPRYSADPHNHLWFERPLTGPGPSPDPAVYRPAHGPATG